MKPEKYSSKPCPHGPSSGCLTFLRPPSLALVLDVEMPLAADARDVARCLQPLRQRDDLAAHRDAVVLDADLALVLAAHQSGSRRCALRCGDVAAGEAHTVAGEMVHVRRADVLVDAVGPKIGPAVVVGEDDDDVGAFRNRNRPANHAENGQEQVG